MKHEEKEPVGKFSKLVGDVLIMDSYNTRVAFASKVIRSFSCAQLSDSDACLVTMGKGSIRRIFDSYMIALRK